MDSPAVSIVVVVVMVVVAVRTSSTEDSINADVGADSSPSDDSSPLLWCLTLIDCMSPSSF